MEIMNNSLLKYIKTNAKFQGNEDLCEDFLAEALRRSCAVADGIDDISFIEPYLKKVVNTSILTVLKNSGRVQRVKNSFVPAPKVVALDEIAEQFKLDDGISSASDSALFSIENIPDPKADFIETVANKDLLTHVCTAVKAADAADKSKEYYNIFIKRYVELKKQSEIAQDLDISQSQVCKRLYELTKIIKKDVIEY